MTADILETRAAAKPTKPKGGFWSGYRLPEDLLAAATKRLGYLCLLGVVIHALAWVAWFATAPEVLAPPGRFPMGHVAAFASIAVSAALYLAIRKGWISQLVLLDVALAFEVFFALGISLEEFTDPATMERLPTGISWVCWWISIFPLMIPNTWGKTLVAAFLSALTGPFAILLLVLVNGNPMPSGEFLILVFFPNFIAVGWAAAASRIVFALGTAVGKAREMGSYRLVERLGAGGMGEVWRASHRMLARPAAVKLIRVRDSESQHTGASVSLVPRFEKEAQATAALQSPHTIDIYDFGVSKAGDFYYVMELLDGLDLATLVEADGQQPPERVVHILRQACHSLHEAHESDLIHRDVKPANLFLCRYGSDFDFVKVLDFGLVKEKIPTETDAAMTQEGNLVGTPAFMAPEMALGEEQVDGRADIYALGCVAYWLLTGSLVFEADTPMATLVKHAHDEPDPPSKLAELEVPAALDELILECLKKDPAERPQTARGLAERLAQVAFDRSWSEERMARWWERHRPVQGK